MQEGPPGGPPGSPPGAAPVPVVPTQIDPAIMAAAKAERAAKRKAARVAPPAVSPPADIPPAAPAPEPRGRKAAAAATTIAAAKTGQPLDTPGYNGSGRTDASSIYNPDMGMTDPIFGAGRYTAPSADLATEYGPNVSRVYVQLKNPLVIQNDAEWRALTQEAGWPYSNLAGTPDPAVIRAHLQSLRATVEGAGHDGVVVRVPEDERTGKTMQRMFGHSQVVEFKPQSAPPETATAAIAPTPSAPTVAATEAPSGGSLPGPAWLNHAMPSIARAATVPGWNIQHLVTEATNLMDAARTSGPKPVSVGDFLRQQDVFSDRTFSPEAQALALRIEGGKPVELGQAFKAYADAADAAAKANGAPAVNLFGEAATPPTPSDAFHELTQTPTPHHLDLATGMPIQPEATAALIRDKIAPVIEETRRGLRSAFIQKFPALEKGIKNGRQLLDRIIEWGAVPGYASHVVTRGVTFARNAAERVQKGVTAAIERAMVYDNVIGAYTNRARQVSAHQALITELKAKLPEAQRLLYLAQQAMEPRPSAIAKRAYTARFAAVEDIEAKIRSSYRAMNVASKAAENLQRHWTVMKGTVDPAIYDSPAMHAYLETYKRNVEQPLQTAALQGGLLEEHLRPVRTAFVPLDPKFESDVVMENGKPKFMYPDTKSNTLKKSSATKGVSGAADSYGTDVQAAVERVARERFQTAAKNEAMNALIRTGRAIKTPTEIGPGETGFAFNDEGQLVPPNTFGARKFVAVPDRAAAAWETMKKAMDRDAMPTEARWLHRKISGGSRAIELGLSPAATVAHGTRLTSAVGGMATGNPLRDFALQALPGGNLAESLIDMVRVNFRKPQTQARLLESAKAGTVRPEYKAKSTLAKIFKWLPDKTIFGPQKFEARAQSVLADRARALLERAGKPVTSAALNEAITGRIGNYEVANTPGFIKGGQDSGLTGFARFSVPFLRQKLHAMVGDAMVPGANTAYTRAATLSRAYLPYASTLIAGSYLLNKSKPVAERGPWNNPPGHKTDIDLGPNKRTGEEDYLRMGWLDPATDRALRFTMIKAALNGGDARDMVMGPVNVGLDMLSPALRAAIGAAGHRPHLDPSGELARSVPPQFDSRAEVARWLTSGLTEGAGAISGTFGTGYEANKEGPERLADVFGVNPFTHGQSDLTETQQQGMKKLGGWERSRVATVTDILQAKNDQQREDAVASAMKQMDALVKRGEMTDVQRILYWEELYTLQVSTSALRAAGVTDPARLRAALTVEAGAVPRR